jgi:hypothetical protein
VSTPTGEELSTVSEYSAKAGIIRPKQKANEATKCLMSWYLVFGLKITFQAWQKNDLDVDLALFPTLKNITQKKPGTDPGFLKSLCAINSGATRHR